LIALIIDTHRRQILSRQIGTILKDQLAS
jgi:hypothetical protein